MNKEIFYYGAYKIMRIQKKKALSTWLKNETLFLLPSNLRPCLSYNPMCTLTEIKPSDGTRTAEDFEKLCNSFRYYNCSNETGLTIKFYKYE